MYKCISFSECEVPGGLKKNPKTTIGIRGYVKFMYRKAKKVKGVNY